MEQKTSRDDVMADRDDVMRHGHHFNLISERAEILTFALNQARAYKHTGNREVIRAMLKWHAKRVASGLVEA